MKFAVVCAVIVLCLTVAAAARRKPLPDAATLQKLTPAYPKSAQRPSWVLPNPPHLRDCDYRCSGPAPGAVTNISDLRPCDVKVVGALGDSITAAFAAGGSIWEYRDLSYFVGLGANATTTAALLRQANAGNNVTVVGGPVEGHFPEVAGAAHEPTIDFLSAAQSEAVVNDLTPEGRAPQVPYFIQELQTMQSQGLLDINTDWKVLTIWIGANDLCEVCHNMSPNVTHSPQYYKQKLNETLGLLQASVPRLFVNLIPFFSLSQVYNVTQPYANCDLVHALFDECSCMYSPNAQERDDMDIAGRQFNQAMFELSQEWNGKHLADFAVVVQPGNMNFVVPGIDFLSTLDCFHPSELAHESLGVALWNQMLQPVAQKTYPWAIPQVPVCPAADAKFYSN